MEKGRSYEFMEKEREREEMRKHSERKIHAEKCIREKERTG